MENWRRALATPRAGEPKYKILVQAITQDIESGVLPDGGRLPPQRDVSRGLGISVQTVSNAYKELERDGLIRCEVGCGSFVSRSMTDKVPTYILDRSERSVADFSTARIIHTQEHDRAWCETCAALGREDDQPWMRDCRPIAGFERHRVAAAAWLKGLGIDATLDTVLITNGASHAVFLALATLVGSDDTVLCESLTDHGVIGAAHVLGFTLKGLDIDEFGIRPDHFEDICANERISALVCIPNLHNPTGIVMPEKRRRSIARIAERYGVYVIEDDVYAPLLEKRPPPISSFVPDLGFYCTSFTKSVMTGLRAGYLSVPTRFVLRVNGILRVNSWMATPLLAEIATRWVEDGTAERLIRIQRTRLAVRHAMIDEILGDYTISHHPNGLSAWIGIPSHWRVDSLVSVLRQRGIAVTSPDPFSVHRSDRPNALRLCVGADIEDDEVRSALANMRNTFEQYPLSHDFV
ncbi:MAG: PLP-dependent aminotransferase family protein [Candidimonas sp.]|nr:MAG: PLP-dependent aminotransferase family protein [Candidimonas sp.]TAM21248.1 MAG: PLP-dependent aminotransferase family protein [Candidimonas sp.]TAM80514.1 MAG: PLP-dependent aminotransferase family protein [Candidimonas sp.]